MPMKKIACGSVMPNIVSGPDSSHRIAVNDTTDTTAEIAPNRRELDDP